MSNQKTLSELSIQTNYPCIPMQDMNYLAQNPQKQIPYQTGYQMKSNNSPYNCYYMSNSNYVPPQNVVFLPIQSGLQKLSQTEGILLKQYQEFDGIMSGCQIENRYRIFPTDQFGNQISKKPIFSSKQKSGCLARTCLSASTRSLTIDIANENGTVMNDQCEESPFISLEKSYQCTLSNRPELNINFVERGQSIYYGKIKQPFWCMDKGCSIQDQYGNLKFIIKGSCCQVPFFCSLPFQKCQECYFDVQLPTGEVIARIYKRVCLRACNENDCFVLVFPQNITVEEKAQLMSAVIFLDYLYFEQSQKQPKSYR